MKRLILGLLLFLLVLGNGAASVRAEEIDIPNNKFGIHLATPSEEDLGDAADLVNSSGGDWGYVMVVIEENDRDKRKWQDVFDRMREFHLIPIVRLATTSENGVWRQPPVEEAESWANFLDSLNWVIKKRYLVLFNEPNYAAEWGGRVDPEGYAQVALEFARKIKEKNSDFFIMLAGFDASAPHRSPTYEDEAIFLRRMSISLPNGLKELFNYLDGWASHSYPNYGFIGSPTGWGRNSVKGYLWEKQLLFQLGVKKDLPVFITETGWPHAEGIDYQTGLYSETTVAQNFQTLFIQYLSDPQVIAITPFILNYQSEPFDHFSWRKPDHRREFYPQYQTIQQIAKIKGEPRQEQKLKILYKLPQRLIKQSTYQIHLQVRNEGQAIWSEKEGYRLELLGDKENFEYFFSDFSELKPFSKGTIQLHLKTKENLGKFDLGLVVTKDGQPVSNEIPWTLEMVPMVKVKFKTSLLPKIKTSGEDFKFLIYGDKEKVVFERTRVKVEDGLGEVGEVNNLEIDKEYRLVVLKPFYLPRQGFLKIKEGRNEIVFKRMLPIDFNLDGRLGLEDLSALVRQPTLLRLWWLR